MTMLMSAVQTTLGNLLPTTASTWTTIRDEAIKQAVRYLGEFMREELYQDFVAADSLTTRFALTGRDCKLAEAGAQLTPTGLNTSGVAAPTVTPTLVALGSGGSLTAGLQYLAYAYSTPLGTTEITPLASVTVVTSGRITRPAVVLPTGVTGIKDYLGVGPLSADLRLVGTTANGTAQTYGTAGSTANAKPLVNFTALSALGPNDDLEPGTDADGTANAAVETMTVTTAPTAGQQFRVYYSRRPLEPASGTDTIYLPNGALTTAALFFASQALMLAHQAGDTTRFGNFATAMDALVMDLTKRATVRDAPRIRMTGWAV